MTQSPDIVAIISPEPANHGADAPKEVRRCNLPNIRCTVTEKQQIIRNAAIAGLKLSTYVRHMALQEPIEAKPISKRSNALYSPEELAAFNVLARQIQAIGVNLNQLTRLANQTGIISAEIEPLRQQCEQLFFLLLDRLGV